MKKDIFAIPIFEEKINLKKIKTGIGEFAPTWESGVLTTFNSGLHVYDSTWNYLLTVIKPLLESLPDPIESIKFMGMWRNKYDPTSYQGYHIHPGSQWSFIIYEDVTSKTSFVNPIMPLVQNHMGDNSNVFPMDYRPNLEPGSMILFPSFLGHQVLPGNTGTTVSGNIVVEYQ